METLFEHIALKFQSQPENIATEALCFVLDRSAVARVAMMQFVSKTGFRCDLQLTYRTQEVHDDLSRPDIVATNEKGQKCLLIEAKFWAGLTDNQPMAYIDQLTQTGGGLLLFIAPRERFGTLWPELIDRSNSRYQLTETNKLHGELWSTTGPQPPVLAIVSWKCLLEYLLSSLEQAGEFDRAADLKQLMGLAARMDKLAFRPIRSEEMSPEYARRYYDYTSLVEKIASQAALAGYFSMKNSKPVSGVGHYGRYAVMGHTGVLFSFNAALWSQHGGSPLWLSIHGIHWKNTEAPERALAEFTAGNQPRAVRVDEKLRIPIRLALGSEEDAVINSALDQIRKIYDCLRHVGSDESETRQAIPA